MSVGALVPAAGRGERLGAGVPKALALLAGEPLLLHAVRGLRCCPDVGPIVVAAPPAQRVLIADLLAAYDVIVVDGAESRTSSVARALAALPDGVRWVLVHDAARALTPPEVIARVIAALQAGAPAVIPVQPVTDTVKRVHGGLVVATVDRADLRLVQTPQGFHRDVLHRAHDSVDDPAHHPDRSAPDVTDDAGLVERLGVPVATVAGSPDAFKVTRPMDLLLAEVVLRAR